MPQARFNFIELGKLSEVEKDATVGAIHFPKTSNILDVVGILKDVGEPSEITSKTTQKAVLPPLHSHANHRLQNANSSWSIVQDIPFK